jgi:hypothetical protein
MIPVAMTASNSYLHVVGGAGEDRTGGEAWVVDGSGGEKEIGCGVPS